MNGTSIIVGNVEKNFLRRNILLNIKGQYMKKSNNLEANVADNFLEREMLLNTKGQYMKE